MKTKTYAYIVVYAQSVDPIEGDVIFKHDFVIANNRDEAYAEGMREYDDAWNKQMRREYPRSCALNNYVLLVPMVADECSVPDGFYHVD